MESALEYELNDIREFFVAPEQDPFSSSELVSSGESVVERLMRIYNANKSPGFEEVIVSLPAEKVAGAENAIKEALERYCNVERSKFYDEINTERLDGVRMLPTTIVTLVLTLIGGILLYLLSVTYPKISNFFLFVGQLLVIFVWAAVWDPFEAYFINPIEHRRRIANLEKIVRLGIRVRAR